MALKKTTRSKAKTPKRKKAGAAKKAATAKKTAVKKKAPTKKTTQKKVAAKKKAATKKSATKKKAVAKKKAATKKKSTQKKTATKKRAAGAASKKKASKKKATTTKTAKKKTTKKKATATKSAGRRKSSAETPTQGGASSSPAGLVVGQPAPDFALPADDGSTVRLSELRGKNVVIYFYPKDNTPGCTVEACGFRDHYPEIEAKDAVVLGVSKDSVRSHQGFKEKQNLPFPLLSDPEAEMIEAYGSWGEKKFMGKVRIGILRTTVVLDKEGVVRKVFPKVSPKTHAAEVLEALDTLN